MLDAIPSLLGFYPRDSIVVLLATPSDGVILSARVDLADCQQRPDPSEPLAGALLRIGPRPGLGVIVVGYGDVRDEVTQAVSSMLRSIPAQGLFGAVVVGDRWWYDDASPGDRGQPYDPRSSAIGAAAVYAGQQVLPSREAVVASLDLDGGRLPRGVTKAFADAQRRVRALPPQRQARLMARMLEECADVPFGAGDSSSSPQCGRVISGIDAPGLQEWALLATLARQGVAREEYWQRLSRASSAAYVGVWREVVRRTPRRWSVPPLCLLGMAAWQAGEGVLMSTCLDRARRVAPRHPLVRVLSAVCFAMLPPDLWNEMRGSAPEFAA